METTKVLRKNADKELQRIAHSELNDLEKEVKIDHNKLKVI